VSAQSPKNPAAARHEATHAHGGDGVDPQALAAGHEPSGINTRGLMIFTAFFLTGFLLIIVIVIGLYRGMVSFNNFLARGKNEPASAVAGASDVLPPEPRLQPAPGHNELDRDEMARLRDAENAEFTRRGWTLDPDTRKFIIPSRFAGEIQNYGPAGPPIERSASAGPTTQQSPS
jgi:hypothetical protein